MTDLLIATHNAHKKEEIAHILGENFLVLSLSDYDLNEEIVEDGDTFAENAKIKAKYCFDKTGKPSVGDDSGLVVEALGGKPGIRSARYAGDHDFPKNITRVLAEMEGESNRKAYFITVICYYDGDAEHYFEGRVYGQLTDKVFGTEGFGYDPIFMPDGYNQTFAEMPAAEKNKISHRKLALDKFLEFLSTRNS